MFQHTFTGRNRAAEILENGGATFYVQRSTNGIIVENSTMTDGYFVGTVGHEMMIPVESFTEGDISFYIRENYWDLVNSGKFLGAWIEGGYVYLDISDHWMDEYSAIGAGKARKQLAIWDVANSRSIDITEEDENWGDEF